LEKARQIADDVMRAVGDYSFLWNDKSLSLTVSVGLVEVTRNSESMPDVMRNADTACFRAKKQGGVRVFAYPGREVEDAHQRDETCWLQRLQAALDDGCFELCARRIMNLDGPEPHGPHVRMSVRLTILGDAAPTRDEFVRAVERHQLVPHLERWVVQTSFSALFHGAVKPSSGRSLAIRMSAQSLVESSFLDFVVNCFDSAGIAPERICFEVTEGSAIQLDAQGRRFISVLRALGCRFMLYVDGSGAPASFGVLKSLPFDYIRVDGAVVDAQAADHPSTAGVRMLVEHARALGISAFVEQGEVVAIAIDWEVGGEKVLGL
jgi:EAL domain-containing protein (putative c-di-GMP-specific phosphodiesterase class I)